MQKFYKEALGPTGELRARMRKLGYQKEGQHIHMERSVVVENKWFSIEGSAQGVLSISDAQQALTQARPEAW